ncbi:hypothetical protein BGP_1685 [Beggiatoa sp. PS]|nr:hypothetical protein BGP_1685 [Beggiatoa sp. PS]
MKYFIFPKFSPNIGVPQQAFCAGTGIDRGGVAGGDSGGPLIVWDATQAKFGQVGIAMRSNLENLASYTRVMNYVPWINEQLSSTQPQPQSSTVPRNDTFTPSENGMQRRRLDFSWSMPEPTPIQDSPFIFYSWNGITTNGYGNAPVLPRFVYEVGYDYPLQGVIFLGGNYTIVDATPPPQSIFYSPFFIANSRATRKPSTDDFDAPNWYPSTFFSQEAIINAAGKPDLLTATAGQYNPELGQQRIFTEMDFDVYYSEAEDKIGPLACITKNDFDGTTATIEVEANDASDIKTAVVAYTDGQGSWHSVELTANGDKLTGSFTANASTEFFVQTVDGTGNVGVNDADGKYFKVGSKLPTCQIEFTPAACHLYAVNDKGLNNSQFFTVAPDTLEVNNLGPVYKAHDIEAVAMRMQSGELYAAAGDDTDKKGHLYQVDKENGQILDLGSTPCKEVDALAFHPNGTLWAWGQDCGLFRIDNPLAPERAENVIPSNGKIEVEDMTWNTAGTILYGVENLHGGHNPDGHGAPEDSADEDLDFDEGVRLWAYNFGSGTMNTLCDDFMGSLKEVEAMETLPDDSLILGFHGSNNLTFGVVNTQTCQMTMKEELTTPHNDIEGIAWPTKACAN